VSSFIRAAASSIASGRPSRRRQISFTVASGATTRPTARARSTNSAAASFCGSGSSRYSCSPATRSGARLVTSTRNREHAPRRPLTRGAASRRCSKLSRKSRSSLPRRNPVRSSGAPIVWATSEARSSGSVSPARDTQKTPSWSLPTSSAATSRPRRVLPVPPGPVSVRRRVPLETIATSSLSSRWRPTSGIETTGRFVAPSVRRDGKSPSPLVGQGAPRMLGMQQAPPPDGRTGRARASAGGVALRGAGSERRALRAPRRRRRGAPAGDRPPTASPARPREAPRASPPRAARTAPSRTQRARARATAPARHGSHRQPPRPDRPRAPPSRPRPTARTG
jgi:hypothetical protein